MSTLRRYLSLCALLFWQGGFTFYTLVIIPIAGNVLKPNLHLRARITDQAVSWLNWAGVAALVLLLWDLISSRDRMRLRYGGRGVCWAVMFLSLAALFGLHYWLDVLDPPQGTGPANPDAFWLVHGAYIWTSVAQWLAVLVYLGLTIRAWRVEDGKGVVAASEVWKAAGGRTGEQPCGNPSDEDKGQAGRRRGEVGGGMQPETTG